MSRRSPLAVLAVLTLVGSLLAVAAGPAAGKDGEADDPATYSACVGPALESAGFGDVPRRSVSEGAINCMAHYGIMPGTSDNLFSPALGVTRQQMALFLIRAAGPAGIRLPRAVDHGFEDIDGLPREVRTAINQLVELEITRGTTRRTFSPDDIVTRRQMVQFLARFLDIAPVGEGGVDIDDVDPDDDQFLDIEELPHGPYDAIQALFELGITNGTSRTRFSPDRTLTRAQMAMFISRMLAHTNARPAGITMQAETTTVIHGDTVEMVVSVRDNRHQPTDDALVDLFSAESPQKAFNSNGTCTTKVTSEFGDQRCVIDFSDETTDEEGNIPYTVAIDEDLVLWAWTGDLGNRFDADREDVASLQFTAKKEAVDLLVTDDLHPEASRVPFGEWVTITFQAVDEDENPVAEKDVEVRILIIEKSDGRTRDRTNTYETDSSGQFEIRFRHTDPDSRSGDRATLDLNIRSSDLDIKDETARNVATGGVLEWSDDDEEPSILLVEQSTPYHFPSDSGRGRRNTVRATLLDQYGDPVRGERVSFVSSDPEGLAWYRVGKPDEDESRAKSAYRDTTDRRGVASVNYYRKSDLPGVETIEAFVDGIISQKIDHYWIADTPYGETVDNLKVLYYDEEDNTLVIGCPPGSGPFSRWCDELEAEGIETGVYVVTFDANDQFNVEEYIDGAYEKFGETYADFKAELKERDTLEVDLARGSGGVHTFTRRAPETN